MTRRIVEGPNHQMVDCLKMSLIQKMEGKTSYQPVRRQVTIVQQVKRGPGQISIDYWRHDNKRIPENRVVQADDRDRLQ